ncbi:hypothetical protein BKA82DRAFT_4202707, partial [Pisolithus tinctorius]
MLILWNPSLWGELAKSAVVSALLIGCATNFHVDNPHICHTSKYGEDAIILYRLNQYIYLPCHSVIQSQTLPMFYAILFCLYDSCQS